MKSVMLFITALAMMMGSARADVVDNILIYPNIDGIVTYLDGSESQPEDATYNLYYSNNLSSVTEVPAPSWVRVFTIGKTLGGPDPFVVDVSDTTPLDIPNYWRNSELPVYFAVQVVDDNTGSVLNGEVVGCLVFSFNNGTTKCEGWYGKAMGVDILYGGELMLPTEVPDVVGQVVYDAMNAIQSMDLQVGYVEWIHSETVPQNFVISQDPAAGTEVEEGTAVNLIVSDGEPQSGYNPVANDDLAPPTQQNQSVVVDVLSNDYDFDGEINPQSVNIIDPPQNGSAIVNFDGTITYTPASYFVGTDSFTYTVMDNEMLESNTATVTVEVEPPSQVFIPNNAGQPVGPVLAQMETLGFVIGSVTYKTTCSNYERDMVTSMDPLMGGYAPYGATVDVIKSSGRCN